MASDLSFLVFFGPVRDHGAQIANDIRHLLKSYTQTIPTILEIPSKDHPYVACARSRVSGLGGVAWRASFPSLSLSVL